MDDYSSQRLILFWIGSIILVTDQASGLVENSTYPGTTVSKRETLLVFTTIIEPPFLHRTFDGKTGQPALGGFIADLCEKIAQRLKSPYRIQLVAEGGYGVPKPDGSWNGMIGEVMTGEADVAAGALSIRPWRKRAIDYTTPYMTVGIATVIKKPPPGENPPFSSPRELFNQSSIQYGAIPGSLTLQYFRHANDTALQQMWLKMNKVKPTPLEWTSVKGTERVRSSNGSYVFFLESAFAEYLTTHAPCDLNILDQLLNPSDYAFAVKKGSKLLKKINKAINALKENGVIDRLRQKWWRGKCDRKRKKKNKKMQSDNIGVVAPTKDSTVSMVPSISRDTTQTLVSTTPTTPSGRKTNSNSRTNTGSRQNVRNLSPNCTQKYSILIFQFILIIFINHIIKS